jgi:PmbA protein
MTSKESLELARWAVDQARKQGANEVAANVAYSRSIDVEVRAGLVEKLQENTQNGLTLSVYLDHRYSSHSTSDLRKDAVARFIEEAVAMTRYLAQDSYRALPDPKWYTGRQARDLNQVDPAYVKVDTAERIRHAKEIEAAALKGGGKIISATASYSDESSRNIKVHSNGFEGSAERTYFGIGAEVTIDDGAGGRPEESSYATARHLKSLPDGASVGKEAAERAVKKIGQHKIASGRYDLLVENRRASRLFSPLISAVSGRALQQKRSFLDGSLGKPVASDKLTVVEDPFLPAGLGSRLFDGEGITARKRDFIDKGVLKTYFIDNYYGRKMGLDPTTSSPSNLVFTPGSKTMPAIIKAVSKGILVNNFIGGNSNATSGDFSFGLMGFYIEGGEIKHAVNEMNITGNFKELWANLVEVGNDPYPYSSYMIPTLHFLDVQCSGL